MDGIHVETCRGLSDFGCGCCVNGCARETVCSHSFGTENGEPKEFRFHEEFKAEFQEFKGVQGKGRVGHIPILKT
eukprot:Skav234825  [mRNA]  locus=scaffold69:1001545:1003581:- [translate_table: standard]